jgi:hypothetical protein
MHSGHLNILRWSYATDELLGAHADSVRDEPGVKGHHSGNDHFPVKPADYGKFMVISLGCGSNWNRRYSAKAAAKWGIFNWLIKNGTAPIIDMYNSASADMVDINLCVLFRAVAASPAVT